MKRPKIVQHSFGSPGSGGPIGALGRLMESPLSERYEFIELHQDEAFGGVDLRTVRRWAQWLRRERPDMIHVRGLGNEGFHAASAARAAGIRRILVSVHGTQRDLQTTTGTDRIRAGVVSQVLEPITLAQATHVATVCEFAARRPFVARHHKKFVGVVPNGVSTTPIALPDRYGLRAELGISPHAVVLVSVGRLTREKGLYTLAAAIQRLPFPVSNQQPIHLLIVGDGPDQEVLRQRLAGSRAVTTHFLGLRHDVPRVLAASDIFVFPSLHENLSNALLEGLSAGLAVIATSVGGNTEVLSGGVGVLVTPDDPVALSGALTQAIGDPSLRAELGRSGRKRVEDHYSLKRMVEGWDNVYQTVLAGVPRG